ncbi:MAG: 50S ribosomal protein L18 [Actinobacteria bacterium]|nr:50S ribosomal protein L18 [Actinomycetota bacterium]
MIENKVQKKEKRHRRVRLKISGSPSRPRLFVFKSNRQIVAQIIDDSRAHTLLACSSVNLPDEVKSEKGKISKAKEVGKRIAEQALKAGISEVVFDRSGNLYHGRVKALADGAREGGLKF